MKVLKTVFALVWDPSNTEDYDMYTKIKDDEVFIDCKSEELMNYFNIDKTNDL